MIRLMTIWMMLFCVAYAQADAKISTARSVVNHLRKVNGQLYGSARIESLDQMREVARLGDNVVIINIQGGDYFYNGFIGNLIPLFEEGETVEEIQREIEWAHAAGIEEYSMPVNSIGRLSPSQRHRILKIVDTIHELIEEGKTVLVHCAHGSDRTGLIMALYRLIYEGWTAEAAYAEFRRNGHSTVNLITTWGLDQFFFEVVYALEERGESVVTEEAMCERNLIFN